MNFRIKQHFVKNMKNQLLIFFFIVIITACSNQNQDDQSIPGTIVKPLIETELVISDSDDPAIWINKNDPQNSLILGTDKAGILFVFDLQGIIVEQIQESGMMRLNNVDVEYDVAIGNNIIDIAVVTDPDAGKAFVFSLPQLESIDNGGFDIFEGESENQVMGVAIYRRPEDGRTFAIFSRKSGQTGSYLWQYSLDSDEAGNLQFNKVRAFGEFCGRGEIEAIAVDDELGYVFYSDELYGIRKYYADPDLENANSELTVFGKTEFLRDREGISIYNKKDGSGYIIVSDQQADRFNIFTLEGTLENIHDHKFIKSVPVTAHQSDGSEITNVELAPQYANGLFVAMSNNKTFQYYSAESILGLDLDSEP